MLKPIKHRKTSDFEQLPDESLLLLYVKDNNLEAYAELYKRFQHLVYGVCLKYLKDQQDAYDAVMDIFEKTLYEIKKHEVANFKSWLYSTAKNYCLMNIRHKEVERKYFDAEKFNTSSFMDFSVDKHLEGIETEKRHAILKNALSQLKEHQQICLNLFYLNEHSYEEIEGITGFSIKKVKSYIQNGKRNLLNILKDYSEFK